MPARLLLPVEVFFQGRLHLKAGFFHHLFLGINGQVDDALGAGSFHDHLLRFLLTGSSCFLRFFLRSFFPPLSVSGFRCVQLFQKLSFFSYPIRPPQRSLRFVHYRLPECRFRLELLPLPWLRYCTLCGCSAFLTTPMVCRVSATPNNIAAVASSTRINPGTPICESESTGSRYSHAVPRINIRIFSSPPNANPVVIEPHHHRGTA